MVQKVARAHHQRDHSRRRGRPSAVAGRRRGCPPRSRTSAITATWSRLYNRGRHLVGEPRPPSSAAGPRRRPRHLPRPAAAGRTRAPSPAAGSAPPPPSSCTSTSDWSTSSETTGTASSAPITAAAPSRREPVTEHREPPKSGALARRRAGSSSSRSPRAGSGGARVRRGCRPAAARSGPRAGARCPPPPSPAPSQRRAPRRAAARRGGRPEQLRAPRPGVRRGGPPSPARGTARPRRHGPAAAAGRRVRPPGRAGARLVVSTRSMRGARDQDRDEVGDRLHDVLAVVEDQQRRRATDLLEDPRLQVARAALPCRARPATVSRTPRAEPTSTATPSGR